MAIQLSANALRIYIHLLDVTDALEGLATPLSSVGVAITSGEEIPQPSQSLFSQ